MRIMGKAPTLRCRSEAPWLHATFNRSSILTDITRGLSKLYRTGSGSDRMLGSTLGLFALEGASENLRGASRGFGPDNAGLNIAFWNEQRQYLSNLVDPERF